MTPIILGFILATTLFCIVSSTNFTVTASTECTNYFTGTGSCREWVQTGTIVEQMGSCFPANTFLKTPTGFKKMDQLGVGDLLLGYTNGRQIYTSIIGWLHRDTKTSTPYLQIGSNEQSITVSHKHNIALKSGYFVFAHQAQSQQLFEFGSSFSIKEILQTGKFAPFTEGHNYFVYSQNKSKRLLAHDFAHIRNPIRYEAIVTKAFNIWSAFSPADFNTVHPVFNWLSNTFSFLME